MELKSLDQVLGQLRTAAAIAGGRPAAGAAGAGGVQRGDFAAMLKTSLDHVSGMQERASQQARDFELGARDTSLQDVMVSIQKANVGFQQAVQVRNRLVSAYHEIMNMQV